MPIEKFIQRIQNKLPDENILLKEEDRFAHGTDASFYRLCPQVVLKARHSKDIQLIIQIAAEEKTPLTFRAAGTSLSGQAITDSVLVKLTHHFKERKVLNEGKRISLEPGVIGAAANRDLIPYSRKIGPDPASIDSAMLGGILANNASGMCCGTKDNSYKTLHSMELILADGSILNTGHQASRKQFITSHPHVIEGLTSIRQAILKNSKLKERIERKYKIKNTTGYSLNSFLDYEDPIDILQHLMIGSEGTLGFISKVELETVKIHKQRACALILTGLETACHLIKELKKHTVNAVELMDGRSLLNIESPLLPKNISKDHIALLIEIGADEAELLNEKRQRIETCMHQHQIEVNFTEDSEEIAGLWKIRKGLFPIIGARRPLGSTIIIEDVCYPLDELFDGIRSLRQCLEKYNYEDTILFGHALEGNLHFVFSQTFESEEEIKRYAQFMDELATSVLKFHGSLKAEHGTGRNMAPYVEKEWGQDAYQLMQQIKNLLDPLHILNPGVILCNDPEHHIKNLKHVPVRHSLIDHCIECGFCESVCPSKDLSFSPRQRISAIRNLSMDSIQWQFDETCAGDGLCLNECPVDINTGDLVRAFRKGKGAPSSKQMKTLLQINTIASHIPGYSTAMKCLSHFDLAPPAFDRLPKAAKALPNFHSSGDKVIYFPSCINRAMGHDRQWINDTIASLFKKAGFQVIVPQTIEQHCCGLANKSKGRLKEAQSSASNLIATIKDYGPHPIVCENSPCTHQLLQSFPDLQIQDSLTFFAKHLSRFTIKLCKEEVFIFPVCSAKHMQTNRDLLSIAKACSEDVISSDIDCCGFAGDKGFYNPELNASALKNLKQEVGNCSRGFASSRTCEIGLEHHSQIPFNHILTLLDECTS